MLLHFRVQLQNVTKPSVWRKLAVPAGLTFLDFHFIFQAAFGWTNSHLFQFSEKGFGSYPAYTVLYPESDFDEGEEIDAATVRLKEIFRKAGKKFTYIYDFGDSWTHQITLEKITGEAAKKVTLTDGKGACPPEDCGGPWGYEGLKAALRDPGHPEYRELREWLGLPDGEEWDPAAFSLAEAQARIDGLL